MAENVSAAIARRAGAAGLSVAPATLAGLDHYVALLARWNQRINLTALPLDPLTDEAIDRLLVEPLVAARHVGEDDSLVIDIGSGGGSPALPMKIAVPRLKFVLVESRTRKAAFLREAVRQLELADVKIANRRAEQLVTDDRYRESADVVTLRAVRADEELWTAIVSLLHVGGRILWFTSTADFVVRPNLIATHVERLLAHDRTHLVILTKTQDGPRSEPG